MAPLQYAIAACDTMMRRYAAADLPPKGHFHYHQGVFLSGMYETYRMCGNEAYIDYVKAWIDAVFDADGRIRDYVHGDLDDIQPGILLFPVYDRTRDPYYLKCLASVAAEVRDIPENAEGGFWHKTDLKDQMWLDGLYMAGPFCAEYAQRFGDAALARILSLHASTRERLPLAAMDALYAQLFELVGKPRRVLDLACGLNPIYLAARGVGVVGLDAHLGAVALVNRFAEENGLDARAEGADLRTAELPEERFDLALVFKLLPLLGAEGYALLERLNASWAAVSFPTRTLSGRSVGMERNYSSAFEENCPEKYRIAGRFVAGNELIYVLKER